MAVQQNSFNLGEKRVIAIDVGPAGLHHPNLGVGEVVNGALQKIFRRDEVGVEDRNKFALGSFQTLRQRARLESFTVGTVMVTDGESLRGVMVDQPARHRDSFIG